MFGKLKKKIHIIQNIYFKNRYLIPKKTYSMDQEDLAILKYVENKKNGFYVDVGAHHPLQRNNTYLLFKKGWSGINVDINKFSIELFDYLRPEDINLQIAVSDKRGEIGIFYQKEFSQLNTTDETIAREHFGSDFKKKNVKCDTIQNILDNSKFNNKKIDFLNIDIEGAEEKVLKSLNFNIYDPTIICVEILGYRSMEKAEQEINIKNDNIYKILLDKKYKKVWSGPNFCSHLFIKN